MSSRRALGLPITLAIVMIVLLVVLIVGWVLLAVAGALRQDGSAGLYWTVLTIGATLLMLVLAGVVFYLVLSIKAINLNARQSNFIDSVTHELKSPIASLKLFLQTLGRRELSREEREEFYQYMLEDIERLDTLINHVLDAGQVEKGAHLGAVAKLRLDHLLADCIDVVCVRHRLDPATVTVNLMPCQIEARRVELEMIFTNLLDNAVKYGADPPHVEVDLSLEPEAAVVRVADNGPGIPRHERKRIFGRFVRLGLELERQRPGTGLGLHIVRTLVGRLGGKVGVSERESRRGSVFEVRLPATPIQAETVPS